MEYASGPAESPFEPKKRTFARTGTTNELGREEIDIHVCVVCLCGFCSHVSKVLRRV